MASVSWLSEIFRLMLPSEFNGLSRDRLVIKRCAPVERELTLSKVEPRSLVLDWYILSSNSVSPACWPSLSEA